MISPLIALALLAPADTPIEPIDRDSVVETLDSVDGLAICVDVAEWGRTVERAAIAIGTEFAVIITDAMFAWWQVAYEEGVGPNAAMTSEAEAYFVEWLEGCIR